MSERHRVNGDPVDIGKRHVDSFSQRKGRYDAGWTPSESRLRESLLKQFCKLDGASGNSAAYMDSPCWCPSCGRLRDSDDLRCSRCTR